VIVYFLACAALEACLAKAIWVDLVGGAGLNSVPSPHIIILIVAHNIIKEALG
jgi:hypothetical protein